MPRSIPEAVDNKSCHSCQFWNRANYTGQCRRHAPVTLGENRAIWPWTVETDWCGDWDQKIQPNPGMQEILDKFKAENP